VSRQLVTGRSHLVVVVLVLALGLGGVALAQRSSGSVQADVTLLDGKVKVSQTTFVPGSLTLVVVNQGKLSHALAIMGTGLQPKRTPTLGSGKSARLTVTIRTGMYHVWDPVRSSMTHATMLTVKAAKNSSTPSTGSKPSGGTSSGSMTGGMSSGGTSGTGGAVDSPDPCAGMM
jgi:uncharacterized membrane protein YgcG